jgi:hypothetical protein
LRAKAPVAYRVAQTPGEIRDVSTKISNALQQFSVACDFFVILGAADTDFSYAEAALAIFFLLKRPPISIEDICR